MCLVVFDMFIFVARFCVSFLHELRRVYIDNTNTKTQRHIHAHPQTHPADTHTDTLLRLHNVFVYLVGPSVGVCFVVVRVYECISVCVISVFVSNDIWRKFYGVYPKIAETLEPQSLNPKSPAHLPALTLSSRFVFVYLLFIMRFVQLHFIANTQHSTQRYKNTHTYRYRPTDAASVLVYLKFYSKHFYVQSIERFHYILMKRHQKLWPDFHSKEVSQIAR